MRFLRRTMIYPVIFLVEILGNVLTVDLPAVDNLALIELEMTTVFNTLAAARTFAGAEDFMTGAGTHAVTFFAVAGLLGIGLVATVMVTFEL